MAGQEIAFPINFVEDIDLPPRLINLSDSMGGLDALGRHVQFENVTILRSTITRLAHGFTAADVGKTVGQRADGSWTTWDELGTTEENIGVIKRVISSDVFELAVAGDVFDVLDTLLPSNIDTQIPLTNDRLLYWTKLSGKYEFTGTTASLGVVRTGAVGFHSCHILLPAGRSVGEANTGENVGDDLTFAEIYVGNALEKLQFRRLGSTDLSAIVIQNALDIDISVTPASIGADVVGAAAAVQANLVTHDVIDTHFPDAPDDPKTYGRKGNAWSAITESGAVWKFSQTVNASPTDPGSGGLQYNNSDPTIATELRIHQVSDAGIVSRALLLNLKENDLFIVQQRDVPANYQIFKVTGVATDNTTWFNVPVEHDNGAVRPDDAAESSVTIDRAGATSPIDEIKTVGIGTSLVHSGGTGPETEISSFRSSDATVTITKEIDGSINLQAAGVAVGEANRGANLPTGNPGGFAEWFIAMNGVFLEFRTAHSADNSIIVTENAEDVSFTATPASIGADVAGAAAAVQTNLDTHDVVATHFLIVDASVETDKVWSGFFIQQELDAHDQASTHFIIDDEVTSLLSVWSSQEIEDRLNLITNTTSITQTDENGVTTFRDIGTTAVSKRTALGLAVDFLNIANGRRLVLPRGQHFVQDDETITVDGWVVDLNECSFQNTATDSNFLWQIEGRNGIIKNGIMESDSLTGFGRLLVFTATSSDNMAIGFDFTGTSVASTASNPLFDSGLRNHVYHWKADKCNASARMQGDDHVWDNFQITNHCQGKGGHAITNESTIDDCNCTISNFTITLDEEPGGGAIDAGMINMSVHDNSQTTRGGHMKIQNGTLRRLNTNPADSDRSINKYQAWRHLEFDNFVIEIVGSPGSTGAGGLQAFHAFGIEVGNSGPYTGGPNQVDLVTIKNCNWNSTINLDDSFSIGRIVGTDSIFDITGAKNVRVFDDFDIDTIDFERSEFFLKDGTSSVVLQISNKFDRASFKSCKFFGNSLRVVQKDLGGDGIRSTELIFEDSPINQAGATGQQLVNTATGNAILLTRLPGTLQTYDAETKPTEGNSALEFSQGDVTTNIKSPESIRWWYDIADPWEADTVYVVNDRRENAFGNNYICVTGGTSASSGGPTGTGSGIADGPNTLVWDFQEIADWKQFATVSGGAGLTFDTFSLLTAHTGFTDGVKADVLGYYLAGGLGSGQSIYRSTGRAANSIVFDNGHFFEPTGMAEADDYLERIDKDEIETPHFGAIPDSGLPASLMLAQLDFAVAALKTRGGGAFVMSPGLYPIGSVAGEQLTFDGIDDFVIQGRGAVIQNESDASPLQDGAHTVEFKDCSRFAVIGLTADGNRDNRLLFKVPDDGATAKDAHAFRFENCAHFTLADTIAIDAVNDGYIFEGGDPNDTNTGCVSGEVINGAAKNCFRNGASVLMCNGLEFSGGDYSESNGTDPQTGIDWRPVADPADGFPAIQNGKMRGVRLAGNVGGGGSTIGLVSGVEVIDCEFLQNARAAMLIGTTTLFQGNNVSRQVIQYLAPAAIVATFNDTTDIWTLPLHGYKFGDTVRLATTGTLPSPFATLTDYRVINATSDTFQLVDQAAPISDWPVGYPPTLPTPIDGTGGSGIHTVQTFVQVDDLVVSSSNNVYRATIGGLTSGTEPTHSDYKNPLAVDAEVTWKFLGTTAATHRGAVDLVASPNLDRVRIVKNNFFDLGVAEPAIFEDSTALGLSVEGNNFSELQVAAQLNADSTFNGNTISDTTATGNTAAVQTSADSNVVMSGNHFIRTSGRALRIAGECTLTCNRFADIQTDNHYVVVTSGVSIIDDNIFEDAGAVMTQAAILINATAVVELGENTFGTIAPTEIDAGGIGRRRPDTVTPIDYGAIGDGIADDTVPCQKALDTHLPVIGVAGKRFLITSGLTWNSTTGDEVMRLSNIQIFPDGVFVGLTISRSSPGTATTTSTNIRAGASEIPVTSVAGFTRGDIVRLTSDTLWPYDNRGTAINGEMSIIASVEPTQLIPNNQVFSEYKSTETVTVVGFRPIRVELENVTIDFGDTPVESACISINGSNGGWAHNCHFRGGAQSGMNIGECYGFDVVGCQINDGWLEDVGLNYGVAFASCTNCGVYSSTITAMRRTVDQTASNYPCHGISVVANTLQGPTSEDVIDPENNDVVGTHGGASHYLIASNKIYGASIGVLMRGPNGSVLNNQFLGNRNTCIFCTAAYASIIGNTFDGQPKPHEFGPNATPSTFVEFSLVGGDSQEDVLWLDGAGHVAPIIVRDNTIRGVRSQFIDFSILANAPRWLVVENNNVTIQNSSGTANTSFMRCNVSKDTIFTPDPTNSFNATSHGFVADDRVTVGGVPPSGYSKAISYFVLFTDTSNFQLSLTSAGPAVVGTDTGTGVQVALTANVANLEKSVIRSNTIVPIAGTYTELRGINQIPLPLNVKEDNQTWDKTAQIWNSDSSFFNLVDGSVETDEVWSGFFIQQELDAQSSVVSVFEFSANPDGTTATETEVQAAADASVGQTLFFPKGNYRLDTNIDLDQGSYNVVLDPEAVLDFSQVTGAPANTAGLNFIGTETSSPALFADLAVADGTATLVAGGHPFVVGDVLRLFDNNANSYSGFDASYRTNEYLVVKDVAGDVLTFQRPIYFAWTAINTTVSKIESNTFSFSGGQILGNKLGTAATSNTACLNVKFATGGTIEKTDLRDSVFAGLSVLDSFNYSVRDIRAEKTILDAGEAKSHGVIIGNSQTVRVKDSYGFGDRNGVSLKGTGLNLDVWVENCTLASVQQRSAEIKGNAERSGFRDCTLNNGGSLGGQHNFYTGCEVYEGSKLGIECNQCKGYNHTVSRNNFYVHRDASAIGDGIVLLGFGSAVDANVVLDGTFVCEDNTFNSIDDGVADLMISGTNETSGASRTDVIFRRNRTDVRNQGDAVSCVSLNGAATNFSNITIADNEMAGRCIAAGCDTAVIQDNLTFVSAIDAYLVSAITGQLTMDGNIFEIPPVGNFIAYTDCADAKIRNMEMTAAKLSFAGTNVIHWQGVRLDVTPEGVVEGSLGSFITDETGRLFVKSFAVGGSPNVTGWSSNVNAVDVASATDVDLSAVPSGTYVTITGTTTIAGWGPATMPKGTFWHLRLQSALTLQGNSFTFWPGGGGVAGEVDDTFTLVSEQGNDGFDVRCIDYTRAADAPAVLSVKVGQFDAGDADGATAVDFVTALKDQVLLTQIADSTITFNFTTGGPAKVGFYSLQLVQDGTGGWVATLPSGSGFTNGPPEVFALDPNEKQTIQLYWDGSEATYIVKKQAFGELFTDNGTVAMTGITTPEKMTLWASEGDTTGMTVSAANDEITFDKGGQSLIAGILSYTGTGNIEFHIQVRVGGTTLIPNLSAASESSASGKIRTLAFVGLYDAEKGDVISIFIDADASASFTLVHGNFIIRQG